MDVTLGRFLKETKRFNFPKGADVPQKSYKYRGREHLEAKFGVSDFNFVPEDGSVIFIRDGSVLPEPVVGHPQNGRLYFRISDGKYWFAVYIGGRIRSC